MDDTKTKKILQQIASLFLVVATVFMVVLVILAIVALVVARKNMSPVNTISVSGTGEVFAVPDVATFTITMQSQNKDVTVAQEEVSEQSSEVITVLEDLGIEEKDIKTSQYSSNPRYDYQRFNGQGEIVGYEVMQTLTVKVRDIEVAGKVLGAMGELDVSNIYGPQFEIDDPDALQAEARALAIEDAEAKAKELARGLDSRLGKVVSFQEGGAEAYPMMYNIMEAGSSKSAVADMAVVPELPTGENQVVSSVTITYKLK